MTARLATHPDVAPGAASLLERLLAAGVDVEPVQEPREDRGDGDVLRALLEERVDLAAVGIRALQGAAADRLTTLAALAREDPRDALLALAGPQVPLRALPRRSAVGVAGPRRRALLLAHRPDLRPVDIAGRDLRDLLEHPDGLAAAVVTTRQARRAGLSTRVAEMLDPKSWLPEPGQGIVALVARHPIAEVTALDHLPTRTALRAELALVDALGSAGVALGSLAQPSGRLVRLWAAVASRDGRRLVRCDLTGPLDEPDLLGGAVARQLLRRGADMLLAEAGA